MDYPSPVADPYEGFPKPAPGMVLTKEPPDPIYFTDPMWYDSMGGNRLQQYDVFNPDKSAEEQINLVKRILQDSPRDPEDHDRGYEIVFQAGVYGSVAVTRWLLKDREPEFGGPIDLSHGPPNWDKTVLPIHAAAFRGHLPVIKCLIEECHLPIDQRSPTRETGLMRAAFGGNLDVVRYLLEQGADPSVTTESPPGSTESNAGKNLVVVSAVDEAVRSGNMDVLLAILEALATRAGKPATRQHAHEQLKERVQPFTIKVAAQTSTDEMLSFLLKEGGYGVDLSTAHDDPRRRAIIGAIPWAPKTKTGSIAVARLLLNQVFSLGSDGKYASSDDAYLGESLASGVINAASRGYPDMLRLFATVLRDSCAATPAGEPEAFKKLLGEEALGRTCRPRSLECASILIDEFGVDINTADPTNSYVNVLDSAVRVGSLESAEYFLDRGIDLHRGRGSIANGPTPLWIAVNGSHKSFAEKILEHGGPVESKDEQLIGAKAVRVESELAYRCPVRLLPHTEDRPLRAKGLVTLQFEDGVTKEWYDKIQIRRSDEELARDGTQRPLQGPLDKLTPDMIAIPGVV